MARAVAAELASVVGLGSVGQHQVDQGVGQEHHAHGRGDDDGQDPPQAEGHPVAEGDHVAAGPPGGQRRGHRAHHRDRHDPVGELEEPVGVRVRGDGARHLGPVGQGQDDHQGHLVGHHPAEGPTGQAGDGAHGLVGRAATGSGRAGWARSREGTSRAAWTTTPRVVPTASSTRPAWWASTEARLGWGTRAWNHSSTR